MAAEKKKVDEKKADKKAVKKVAIKPAKAKKSGKKLAATDLVINVPLNGQVIKTFDLMPAKSTAAAPGDWIFTEEGSTVDIENLVVGFELNPSALNRHFERAILIIRIKQNPASGGTWRFALGGIATDNPDCDPDNDIAVEIIDNGFTMIVHVQVLENSAEYVPFGFVASLTNQYTGVVTIYESKDPGIIPKRPN